MEDFGLIWDKKINAMNDTQDPYEVEIYSMGENIQVDNLETESNGRRNQETPSDIAANMRSLVRVELQSC